MTLDVIGGKGSKRSISYSNIKSALLDNLTSLPCAFSSQILVFIADFVFPSRRFNSPNYYQSEYEMTENPCSCKYDFVNYVALFMC